MAVKKTRRGDSTELSIPTDANRDIGVFLLFLSVFAVVPLYALTMRLVFETTEYDWNKGLLLALGMGLIGVVLILFSRKKITVSQTNITVKDGLFRPGMRFGWSEQPAVRLYSIEEERGGRQVEVWLVNLVDGKNQYTLDQRVGQQMASRTLAEMVAKTINCPVIEKAGGKDVRIERSELDLPFVERVHRHPILLGQEVDKPSDCAVKETLSSERQEFHWRLWSAQLVLQVGVLFAVLFGFSLLPLGKSTGNRSLLDLARLEKEYLYFYALAGLLVIALVMLAGYRVLLVADRQQVSVRATVFGVPVRSQSIPVTELEDIAVRNSAQGAFLQFISDALIITQRLDDLEAGRWVASLTRRFYAKVRPGADL